MALIDIQNWISVAGILVSLGIATWTGIQSKLASEAATRPIISIYYETIDTVFLMKYIAIKNFGKTSATIKKITFAGLSDDDPRALEIKKGLKGLEGSQIAPTQKFTMGVDVDSKLEFQITVEYENYKRKQFKETFLINSKMTDKLLWTQLTATSNEAEIATTIKNAAASIVKTLK